VQTEPGQRGPERLGSKRPRARRAGDGARTRAADYKGLGRMRTTMGPVRGSEMCVVMTRGRLYRAYCIGRLPLIAASHPLPSRKAWSLGHCTLIFSLQKHQQKRRRPPTLCLSLCCPRPGPAGDPARPWWPAGPAPAPCPTRTDAFSHMCLPITCPGLAHTCAHTRPASLVRGALPCPAASPAWPSCARLTAS
jgi:hypothetical protein